METKHTNLPTIISHVLNFNTFVNIGDERTFNDVSNSCGKCKITANAQSERESTTADLTSRAAHKFIKNEIEWSIVLKSLNIPVEITTLKSSISILHGTIIRVEHTANVYFKMTYGPHMYD